MPEDAVDEISRPQMWRVDDIVGALRVLLEPLALVGRVVEHEVGERQHLPLVPHLLHELAHVFKRVALQHRAEVRVQFELVTEAVAGLGRPQLLQGGEVDHVVARLLRHPQSVLPLRERAQELGEHRLACHCVEGQLGVVLTGQKDGVNNEVAAAVGCLLVITASKHTHIYTQIYIYIYIYIYI